MLLSGNYIGRSGGFLYSAFAKDALLMLNGSGTNATLLYRSAVDHGASERCAEDVLKNLRIGLSNACSGNGFKRYKEKGQAGYFFKSTGSVLK